jgi:hypothetical protein
MTTTYSVAEAAQIICGASDARAVKWLTRRLRGEADPVLPGYKERQHWRMTDADIAAAIELLRPQRMPSIPVRSSMTRTSRRRLAS